nr:MAG TPA: hypothetical protein [Bacteriophage sp.]
MYLSFYLVYCFYSYSILYMGVYLLLWFILFWFGLLFIF